MIDLTTFNWLPGERVWMRPSVPGRRLEIVIGGNKEGPDPARVLLAEDVLPHIEQAERKATAYLDAFVDRAKFARNEEWFLDSIEFGRCDDEPLDEFVTYFALDEDIYGLWSVRLRRTQHAGIVAVMFARRNQ